MKKINKEELLKKHLTNSEYGLRVYKDECIYKAMDELEEIYSKELKESELIREQLNAQSTSDGETMNELCQDLQKAKDLLLNVLDDMDSIQEVSLTTLKKLRKYLNKN